MYLTFTTFVRAFFLFCLLPLPVLPALAFDEDHHEVINGTALHFRVRGTDKAHPYLVLLHGGPGFSSHMFYAWGASLEKNLNVVYLDQRGSGESARLTMANVMAPTPAEIKDYTVTNLLGDIEGVRQFLKVGKWYVLGHSWGGMLGLEYVTAHSDHVRGYIHMDGLVSVPQMQNAVLDNAEKKFAAATPKNNAALAQVAQLRALPPDNPVRLFSALGLAMGPAGLYFAGDQTAGFAAANAQIGAALKPYHLALTALAPASEPTAALIVNDHFLTRDDTPLLAKVTVPTMILSGKQDGVIPPSAAEATHAAIKGSQIAELDDCGHFPFFEQPKKTTAALLTFVNTGHVFMQDGHIIEPMGIGHGIGTMRFRAKTDPSKLTAKQVVVSWTVDEQGNPMNIKFPPTGSSDVDRAIMEAIKEFRIKPERKDGQVILPKLTHIFVLSN